MARVDKSSESPQAERDMSPATIMRTEMGLIGFLMIYPGEFWTISDSAIQARHFADELRGNIWAALCALRTERGKVLSTGIVMDILKANGVGDERRFIADARDAAPQSAEGGKELAELLRIQHMVRIVDEGTNAMRKAVRMHSGLGAVVEAVEKAAFEAINRGAPTIAVGTDTILAQELQSLVDRDEAQQGLSTGFPEIDDKAKISRGEMTILAARPSVGKSSAAAQMVGNWVLDDAQAGLVVTTEMNSKVYLQRMLCQRAMVSLHARIHNRLNQQDSQLYIKQIMKFNEVASKLKIWGHTGTSITQIRSMARRYKEELGITFLVVDYIQQISGTRRKGDTRDTEVTSVSNGLKEIATNLDIAVLVISSLNRKGAERGPTARPKLEDLRDSGSLESDADKVFMMWSEDYAKRNDPEHQATHETEFILEKNRNGPCGIFRVYHNAECGIFQPLGMHPAPSAPPEGDEDPNLYGGGQ